MCKYILHLDKHLNTQSNDTIVLVEGIGANLKGWDLFVDHFVQFASVIRYDHPCSGKSLLLDGDHITEHSYMEALKQTLDDVEGNVHLVGYSLGGFVVLKSILREAPYSDDNCMRIKSITIGAGFVSIYSELLNTFKSTRKILSQGNARKNHIESLPFLYDAHTLENNIFYDFLIRRCVDDQDFISSDNFVRQLDACINATDWRIPPAITKKSNIPLLLMYAEDDKIIPSCKSVEVCNYFSSVSTHVFKNGGHCFKDVHRELFLSLVSEHIKKNIN